MGKDADKEDTGFGFKDKAKAEETIELLKSHDLHYQKLTVRGLLGRAKRVLTLTKAEEKLKNIKEAMKVFEEWMEQHEGKKETDSKKSKSKEEKDSKKSKSKDEKEEQSSPETVPGLGFKDKEKALETIKLLEGRDPDYQKLAIKGLIGRAKRVLTCTKDKEKLQNIKDAMKIFDDFLDDFDKKGMSKQNMTYLPFGVVESCVPLLKTRGLSKSNSKALAFIEAFKAVDGEYKKLRTVEDEESGTTWDIVRNEALKKIKKEIGEAELFEDNGNPSNEHLKMIIWAYSPEEHRMKWLEIVPEDSNGSPKRKHGEDEDESPNKKKK